MAFRSTLAYREMGKHRWQLTKPLIWDDGSIRIQVPRGYITDFASIPPIFWPVLPKHARYSPAAVIHDWIYSDFHGRYTKEEADQLFYDALINLGVRKQRAWAMHKAVKLFGKGNWPK
ncbi:MAG: DUF1353 domain-containing protein [Pseudomonadota bacterium]